MKQNLIGHFAVKIIYFPFFRVLFAAFNLRGCEHDSGGGTTLEMFFTVAVADIEECLVEKMPAESTNSKTEKIPVWKILTHWRCYI